MPVVFLIAFAIAAFLLLFAVTAALSGRGQKGALARKDEELDALFDGSQQVMYSATYANLPADVVLAGGNERGYRLVSDQRSTYGPREMVFEKD